MFLLDMPHGVHETSFLIVGSQGIISRKTTQRDSQVRTRTRRIEKSPPNSQSKLGIISKIWIVGNHKSILLGIINRFWLVLLGIINRFWFSWKAISILMSLDHQKTHLIFPKVIQTSFILETWTNRVFNKTDDPYLLLCKSPTRRWFYSAAIVPARISSPFRWWKATTWARILTQGSSPESSSAPNLFVSP